MGSCVSVHKSAGSAMKFRLSTDKVLIPSPTKEDINGDYPVSVIAFKSQSTATPPVTGFRDLGSKEETFFDSQAWLESDCDDDFFSVNGDFTPSRNNTPSRGSTPNHQSSLLGACKPLFMDTVPKLTSEPSPTGKKKRLSELFEENSENDDDQNVIHGRQKVQTWTPGFQPNSTSETPRLSGAISVCSSEKTPSRDPKTEKMKLSRSVQCCLPSLVPSRKSSEKKISSPGKDMVE